ncbi:hypothetical protein ACXDF8_12570 [Mycolicibacterium sp. CBM1]
MTIESLPIEQAGIPTPTDQWTWDDLRAAAAKLNDPAKSQYGWLLAAYALGSRR